MKVPEELPPPPTSVEGFAPGLIVTPAFVVVYLHA